MLSNVLPPVLMNTFLVYIIVINLFTLVLFGLDKRAAKLRRNAKRRIRRVPERTLLLFAALGGSVGALFGMWIYHHKTRHRKFTVGVPLILLAHIILFCAAVFILTRLL